MKILHTSDWHLGQNFMGRSREKEHGLFLEWLLLQLKNNPVDALIVAGDIFDTGTPPNYALKLYFNFLYKLSLQKCNHVVIIGGNHDSIATLSSTKQLLSLLKVNVIADGNNLEEEIVLVKDKNKLPIGIICGIPFLKDRVVRKSIPGESYEEKAKALIKGIKKHYRDVAKLASKTLNGKSNIPIIGTGHLLTKGAIKTDSEREIFIGSLNNIDSSLFPKQFDYIALGHLHRAQKVGNSNKIRYSGSPIPLSFSEAGQDKFIYEVTIPESDSEPNIKAVKIPEFRKLRRISSSVDDVENKIREIATDEDLKIWIEVCIKSGKQGEYIHKKIIDIATDLNIEVLAVKNEKEKSQLQQNEQISKTLKQLSPMEVFEKRLELEDIDKEEAELYKNGFREIISEIDAEDRT